MLVSVGKRRNLPLLRLAVLLCRTLGRLNWACDIFISRLFFSRLALLEEVRLPRMCCRWSCDGLLRKSFLNLLNAPDFRNKDDDVWLCNS